MMTLPQFLTSRSSGVGLQSQKLSSSTWVSTVLERTSDMFGKDLRAHYGCVNAIEFSNNGGEWIASGGDDRRILLWNVEKNVVGGVGKPIIMTGEHHSNIFCIAFDESNKKIISGGNDEQVLVHDIKTGETLDVFLHDDAVYGLSVDPFNEKLFASASDDGRIVIYDMRAPSTEEPFVLAESRTPMHSVHHNPVDSRLLASANSKDGIALWDVRIPKLPLLKYGGLRNKDSCMSVRFNVLGSHLLALRRRLPPVLYELKSAHCMCIFEQTGYFNSCTMKSCSFVGDEDQYIISGSDDFNLYVWKIPSLKSSESAVCQTVTSAHLILKGHRSIVNQVRYSKWNNIIISSGVEKIIKVWSPFCIPGFQGRQLGGNRQPNSISRPAYSHDDYVEMMIHGNTGSPVRMMTHDYSHESTEEDSRMIAFFDSLIRHEREELGTDDTADDEDSDSDIGTQYLQFLGSEQSASNSGNEDDSSNVYDGRVSLNMFGSEGIGNRQQADEDPNMETVILLGRRATNRSTERRLSTELEISESSPSSLSITVRCSSSSTSSSDDLSASSSSSSSGSDSYNGTDIYCEQDNGTVVHCDQNNSTAIARNQNVDTAVASRLNSHARIMTSCTNVELTVNRGEASTLASLGASSSSIEASGSEQRDLNPLFRLRQLRKRVQRDDDDECKLVAQKTYRMSSNSMTDFRTSISDRVDSPVTDRNCSITVVDHTIKEIDNGDNDHRIDSIEGIRNRDDHCRNNSMEFRDDTPKLTDNCDRPSTIVCQRTSSDDLIESSPCFDRTDCNGAAYLIMEDVPVSDPVVNRQKDFD